MRYNQAQNETDKNTKHGTVFNIAESKYICKWASKNPLLISVITDPLNDLRDDRKEDIDWRLEISSRKIREKELITKCNEKVPEAIREALNELYLEKGKPKNFKFKKGGKSTQI